MINTCHSTNKYAGSSLLFFECSVCDPAWFDESWLVLLQPHNLFTLVLPSVVTLILPIVSPFLLGTLSHRYGTAVQRVHFGLARLKLPSEKKVCSRLKPSLTRVNRCRIKFLPCSSERDACFFIHCSLSPPVQDAFSFSSCRCRPADLHLLCCQNAFSSGKFASIKEED